MISRNSSERAGRRRAWGGGTGILLLAALGTAACGSDSKKSTTAAATPAPATATPTTLAVTTSDAPGKRFTMQAPATIKGGLVQINFTNASKAPHELGLIRVDGTRTLADVLKIVNTSGPVKIPAWIHAEGGVSTTAPGKSGTSTQNLPAGHYFVTDTETGGNDSAPAPSTRGASAEFDVTPGTNGALPATPATIKIVTDRKDHYQFQPTGLTAGTIQVTFANDSDADVVHHVVAFPINPGKTITDVKKAFNQNGPSSAPPPVDFAGSAGTEVLDGKEALVTSLTLKKGHYALVCFLNDRDDLKPHFNKGLLKEVIVQ